MSEISPVPYSDPANSFSWLEWFRQVRDKVNAISRHGAFSNTVVYTLPVINTPTLITFDSTVIKDGISTIDGGAKVQIPRTGVYSFSFSAQIQSSSASTKTVWFWPRVNGVDVPGYTMIQTISGAATTMVVSRVGAFKLNIGDYLQAYWTADSTSVTLAASPATSFSPASPSAILSVMQLS
ncbi:MAG: hypothetical protein QX189_09540 [Methylococcales bacterium]